MKKLITSLVIIASVLSITALVFANGGKEEGASGGKQFVTIVTGGTGGTYYPVGTIFATLWNEKLGDQGIQASAQSSGGSVENISMLSGKEAQLGIAVAGLVADAQKGMNVFADKQYSDIRLITGLYPELEQFVVTVSSGIKTLADVKGKRFSVGAVGSGAESASLYILEVIAGLKPGDYQDEHLGYSESSAAMQNGQLDGMNIEAGILTSAVSEITASKTKVTILNFTQSDYDKLRASNQNYGYFTIPAGTYTGIDKDIKAVGVRAALVTDANVSEDLVYQLTKTLYENVDQIRGQHNALSQLSKEDALTNLPAIKLHAGALKYYEENGIEIPAGMK